MDFLGGALPNVVFIVGVLAVGLGLGIELKLVPLNKEINQIGRIGAFLVGLSLIGASIVMYLNPALVPQQPATAASTTAVPTTALVAAPVADAVLSPSLAAEGVAPNTPAVAALVTAPVEAAITDAPPTPQPAAPTAITVAAFGISVPNLRGLDDKGAKSKLQKAGLNARKADMCSGTDQGDPKTKKGHIQCQNPVAGQSVAPGSTVEYVLMGK